MESWQVYSYAMKLLSPDFIQRLYTRSTRLIYRWAADPAFADSQRNPIDRLTLMLRELDLAGRGDVARAAIDIIARPLGGRFAYNDSARSDKGTVDGEAADLSVALGSLIDSCRAAEDGDISQQNIDGIVDMVRTVKNELNQMLDVVVGRVSSGR